MRLLAVYLVGVFLGALDANVLGPVFPLIARGFHISFTWTAWTVTAYTVAYVASTVLAGATGDRVSRKKVFMAGLGAFGLASLLAAVAPTFPVFLLARIIQGAGAGAVYPNAQAEGVAQFPKHRRGSALGMFGAVFGLASIVGPNAGGALGQYLGWRSIFWVNVPLSVLVLLLAAGLPESPRGERALPDWAGGLAFAGTLAAALLTIMVSGSVRWGLLALTAASVLLFWQRQRTARQPFLDTRPLSSASGVAMMIGAALIGLDMSAAVFVPTLAQAELHLSVLGSGVALMPAALSGAVLAGLGGVLVDRVGAKAVLEVGLLAGVLGGILLALPHLHLVTFGLAMVAFGLSTAFTMGAPLNRMALAIYRDDQAGEALSLVAVFRAVGLSAGPVLLTLAQAARGFTGMFGSVAVASLLGMLLFLAVPDVRPATRGERLHPARESPETGSS